MMNLIKMEKADRTVTSRISCGYTPTLLAHYLCRHFLPVQHCFVSMN